MVSSKDIDIQIVAFNANMLLYNVSHYYWFEIKERLLGMILTPCYTPFG